MEDDTFSEDKSELEVLTRKPVCFVIFGKPGAGKTTLAKRLAAVWKCQLVDGTNTIEQAIRDATPLGIEAKQKLLSGEELDEAFVAQIIEEKLSSPEIKHYGYVLDCFPSASEAWRSVEEQLQLVSELTLSPDVIINLKIPDQDLLKRRVGQKVDPLSNELFIKSLYEPKSHTEGKKGGEGKEGEEEEEGEEGGKEDREEEGEGSKENKDDEFQDDLRELENLDHLAADIAGRLVQRSQDLSSAVEEQITHYKENMLRTLENFIIQHNQQYVIELDANLTPRDLFRALLVRLSLLGLPRSLAPHRLIAPGEEEEEPEGIETEQFLQQLSETGVLVPRFRWRRSRWGRFCPVQLAEGNMVAGKMEFSVGFLDKMYSMSSPEALVQFTRNPRAYLLPPHPRIPCKVCVVGPPTSGKSTLAKMVAEKYNAMVLDYSTLLGPVVEKAQQAAVETARQEALTTAITTITAQLAAQHSQAQEEDSSAPVEPLPEVTADHPGVQQAVATAEQKARDTPPELTQEMYMVALRTGVEEAEEKRRREPQGPRFGGWVVDGFPLTRENWAAMIDYDLLPDFVLSLVDEKAPADYLLTRFTEMHGLPNPVAQKATQDQEEKERAGEKEEGRETEKDGAGETDKEGAGETESEEKSPPVIPEEVKQWRKGRAEFDRHWGQLLASIKGSAIDPLPIDCSLSPEEMLKSAVGQMEGVFEFNVTEFSAQEEDADIDDDPVLDQDAEEEGDEGEENPEALRRRKPWGDSAHFCPVALHEQGVLYPGNEDTAARYRERLYYFSSEEAKDKFTANPLKYTAIGEPLEVPPLRVFLFGPRGSGKTVVGHKLASKMGMFHVAFRDYLQEQILPKMKKPPLVDEEDWEGEEKEQVEEGDGEEEEDLDSDVLEKLTEEEQEVRSYLLHGDPLSEETMEKYCAKFWNTDPYKSTGFIMEGFPSSGDELRFLCSKGLFPDTAVIFQLEEADVVRRLLPGKMEVWRRKRDRRVEKRTLAKEKKLKEWEEDKAQRRAELTAEYEARKAAKREEQREEDEEEEEEEEEEDDEQETYRERLAELDEEEFPEEEEEEEEEDEGDAKERIRGTLVEKFEEQTEVISTVQDVLSELQIPYHTVNASRRVPVVEYSVSKSLHRYTRDRQGLLLKSTAIDGDTAKKLLDHGYKQLSKFKRWCPVKLLEDPHCTLPPNQQLQSQTLPVIHRQHIYFTSSTSAREKFMANPRHYLAQPAAGPAVPVRLAIVGPPKSGKSTAAKRFVAEYGCLRLSVGEAMRRVIEQFPDSELTRLMQSYLQVGQTVPDDLCVLALERALLDVQCNTRGYVLDGWPLTRAHVDLLTKFHILPVCVVELEVTDQEMLRRGDLDRKEPNRLQPLHDSDSILLVRSNHYRKHVGAVREWYNQEHDNWHVVNGEQSQWWVWNNVRGHALHYALQIQQYLTRITAGQAASIAGLCITPSEFQARLGEYSQYCPVSLALRGELVDCSSEPSLQYAAEYRRKYYKMASVTELDTFLATPDRFVPPNAPSPLPPQELLPRRRSHADVKAMFPKQFEIQGFCPVSYVDGKKRYESLRPGNPEVAAEYKGKLYCFASDEKLDKFMRQPDHYEVAVLPTKLPPLKQPVPVTSLPMLGYLEQTAATAIINALSAVGSLKPKFPFLNSTKSALIYVAYHLKAYNPKSSDFVRKKYKRKLSKFDEQCQLIAYLSSSMKTGYQEPNERPIDFQHKMGSFLDLKGTTTVAM